jgi:DNA polymerase-3 subunit delta'
MNVQTANAILKLLEEPPANTTLLLICHQPSRLLPTIRSRCRTLSFNRLSAEDMTQAVGASGCSTSREYGSPERTRRWLCWGSVKAAQPWRS